MAAKQSAGLLLFRRALNRPGLEVLLGHPGGPYWRDRHEGAWTLPKGGIHDGESAIEAAVREFREETGFEPREPFLPLGRITQRSGKVVHAWAFEGDCDPRALVSVTARTEWPPRSRQYIEVPEIDCVRFFSIDEAREVINVAQEDLLDRLVVLLREQTGLAI